MLTEDGYREVISKAEGQVLNFLRAFERLQEELHIAQIPSLQENLKNTVGEEFTSLSSDLAELSPPEPLKDFHGKFSQALTCLTDAHTTFLKASGENFFPTFFHSRRAFSTGKYLLYDLRLDLPILQQYWVLAEALPMLSELERKTPAVDVPVGFTHKERTDQRSDYSLYVPENYNPQKSWPLIICLHGGHGQGDDYILTWLRPAKSQGYFLLSPKSIDRTWSMQNPRFDIRSILHILEEIFDVYAIDNQRIFLTGLSDGGTFTYAMGLMCAKLFAGIAPIAAVLLPWLDLNQGKDLPIFTIHGARDFIFPVNYARTARAMLEESGHHVLYKELPDWGHAYTYTINEQLLLPWFATLSRSRE
jgi:phospholipase/carboxylesterase